MVLLAVRTTGTAAVHLLVQHSKQYYSVQYCVQYRVPSKPPDLRVALFLSFALPFFLLSSALFLKNKLRFMHYSTTHDYSITAARCKYFLSVTINQCSIRYLTMAEENVPTADNTKCNKLLLKALEKNKNIQKLIDSIEELGCKIPKDFFACRTCDGKISGGFAVNTSPGSDEFLPKIIACENSMQTPDTFESTLVHELVHAYDVCRSKIDFKNCLQHACTEIRASSLSGECALRNELYRGNMVLYKGHQQCTERRAKLSVSMNPHCKSVAADAVASAFVKCYADTSPFDQDEH